MIDKAERVRESCLKEMFRRVGLKYPNKRFTNRPGWYQRRTWTSMHEADFREWMYRRLRRACPQLSKRAINNEISWFLLMWGWTVNDD